MEKRNLYVIVAVVLIAGLALSFYGNYTGNSTLGTDKGKCLDSDDGNDKFIKGTASYENRNYKLTDYCYTRSGYGDKNRVKEYFCFGGEIDADEHICENNCKDGACIK